MTLATNNLYGSWESSTPPFTSKYGVFSGIGITNKYGVLQDPYGNIFSPFNPSELFATGAPGVWYDLSLTDGTLFQDAAGTTPVTSVEQPVGLVLDKSKGLALGPELVTNGDFSNGTTGWTASGTTLQSVIDGYLRVVAGDVFGSYQVVPTTAGKRYEVRGQIAMISGGTNVCIRAESGTVPGSTPIASSSTITSTTPTDVVFRFLATASSHAIYLRVETTGSVGRFDNISVRELPGNHAFQTTSANRPVLSARYNLLTATEDFGNAVWSKGNTVVTSANNPAPDGTNTATLFTQSGTASTTFLSQAYTGQTGAVITSRFFVKHGNTDWVRFDLYVSSAVGYLRWFNTSTGTLGSTLNVGTPTNTSASVSSAGNGWYIVTLSASWVGAGALVGFQAVDADNSSTRVNGGTYLLWHPDVRPTNDGVGLPSYQRVDTATDYDTVGFPLYLRFNGSTQFLQTNSIDFSSTDKVLVAAGVRKLSDAAGGSIFAEISNSINSFAGAWTLNQYDLLDGYSLGSKGTVRADARAQGYFAPITNVLTGLGDISGDRATLRINGAQVAQNTADQGTGNYGNYPLYIGARGGTSLFFNGRLYSLIIAGIKPTDAQILGVETYINSLTKAF